MGLVPKSFGQCHLPPAGCSRQAHPKAHSRATTNPLLPDSMFQLNFCVIKCSPLPKIFVGFFASQSSYPAASCSTTIQSKFRKALHSYIYDTLITIWTS